MAVAIGPYYHNLPELQGMEEAKKAAAYHFCSDSGVSPETVYEKVLDVAGDARSCYADAASVNGISEADFASMMFHDSCFLVQYMIFRLKPAESAPSFTSRIKSSSAVIKRDIMLLENQIPWLVLEVLMTFREIPFCEFIVEMGTNFQFLSDSSEAKPLVMKESYRPPHLLGLFHFYQSGSMGISEDVTLPGKTVPLGTSAIHLAEMGIKLIPSETAEFKDIGLTKGPLFGYLFLPPLYLFDQTACWLTNMAAFEAWTSWAAANASGRHSSGDYTVTTYLALFVMLMDREEDVHMLRAKHLIQGEFTNQQALHFFKGGLSNYLLLGTSYVHILAQLAKYKQKRKVWIAIHKFVFNNLKIIVTVLSITGVLVGIFKTLFSIKQQ